MRIKLTEDSGFWCYLIYEINYTQEQFDYIFKYLDFEKLNKDIIIYLNNEKTKNWFKKTYIDRRYLEIIYNESPLGYEWLKDNWGKNVFQIDIYYLNKQELKTIVNRVINIELIRGK